MQLEIHKGSKGYFVQYPDGFKREDVEPPACGWFAKRPDAEAEALRLAEATGKGFLIVRVVSKCIPWHCHDKAPNVEVTGAARLYRAASGGPQGYASDGDNRRKT